MKLYVWAVYADMEEDTPVAFCLCEDDARKILGDNSAGDVLEWEVDAGVWDQIKELIYHTSPVSVAR